MTIDLPGPVSAYFHADRLDATAVSGCFTEDGVVIDERETHRGRDAIRDWQAAAAARYTYTARPFRVETVAGKTVVTAHLTGNFPGSPVDLNYVFGLRDGLIASLEIHP